MVDLLFVLLLFINMGYPTEIKADFPHQQNIYTSELDKGSKSMPLWGKAVALAKNPAQLDLVSKVLQSEVFYNWDISQWWWLRWSTWYWKNTTQYRPKKSSKNKDSKDSNQESNSEFNLWPVYKDLEKKIAEALLPEHLQWDLEWKILLSANKKLLTKKIIDDSFYQKCISDWLRFSWDYNNKDFTPTLRFANADDIEITQSRKLKNVWKNIIEKSHAVKEILAWISISWKQLEEDNFEATLRFANADDIKTIQSLIPNPYTFTVSETWDWKVDSEEKVKTLEVTVTLQFTEGDMMYPEPSIELQKKQQYIKNKLNVEQAKTKATWWKMYNRKDEKLFLRQAYENQVSQSAIDAQLDDNLVWDWSKEVFKPSQLENEKNIFIKNLLKVSEIFEDFFGKPVKSMTLEELLQLDLTPLENVEDFSQYWLDAYYKWVVETADANENTAHVNTNIAHSDEEIIAKQITSAINEKLTYDEMKWRFDAFNKFEIIDAQIKSAINKLLTEEEKKIQSDLWKKRELEFKEVKKLKWRQDLEERIQSIKDYALFSKKDRIQLLRDYTSFSKKDRETQDMERMGHMILDESNIAKLFEYLEPTWMKQVHIDKFISFIAKYNLLGKFFKDVSNAIFHIT